MTFRERINPQRLESAIQLRSCVVSWSKRFDVPIVLSNGKSLSTLADARQHLLALPKRRHEATDVSTAIEALMMAAEGRGPMMHANAGIARVVFGQPMIRAAAVEGKALETPTPGARPMRDIETVENAMRDGIANLNDVEPGPRSAEVALKRMTDVLDQRDVRAAREPAPRRLGRFQ
jgi:hypothetical protein